MGRLPLINRRALEFHWTGRHSALLHRKRRACKTRARSGFYDFFCRQHHLSQGPADPRCGANGSARPHADRNRLALPGPDSASRPAQRTRVCTGGSPPDRRTAQLVSRRDRLANRTEFLQILWTRAEQFRPYSLTLNFTRFFHPERSEGPAVSRTVKKADPSLRSG